MSNPYDFEPMSGPSQYLKLTDKGDSAKVRIVSEPYRSLKVWKESERKFMDKDKVADLSPEQIDLLMRDPDFTLSEVFTWVVIDRTDGTAKVLSMPASVFKKIAKYAKDEDWGNPNNYDITVERTENPGSNYWSIVPSPKMSELTHNETIAAADVDVAKLVVGAKPLSDPTAQRLTTKEDLKAAQENPATVDPNAVAKELGVGAKHTDNLDDRPIDLSEIPF